MKINLKQIIAHNFLSIGDIDLNLSNRGYVAVQGKNNNPDDNALSNGSGKSSIFNAICWNLTGETIQGLKSNIPNIHGDDGCFVKLYFNIDRDEYEVTRYREHSVYKNDLKIIINGQDKSGKGLRESEALLKQYLPDVDADLIGNIILLGQGLPHKFSNNTPSGRKELLEKLSKSDFMINDIKTRLAKRSAQLDNNLRSKQDELLESKTILSVDENQLNEAEIKLAALVLSPTIDADIKAIESTIDIISEEIKLITNNKLELQDQYQENNLKLSQIDSEQVGEISKQTRDIEAKISMLNETYFNKNADLRALRSEISRLDSIKDVCPTCGKKLDGVEKVDTSQMKLNCESLENELNYIKEDLELNESAKKDIINQITSEFNLKKSEFIDLSNTINKKIKELDADLVTKNSILTSNQVSLTNLTNQKNNFEIMKTDLESKIQSLTSSISSLNNKIMYINNDIAEINDHIDVISKINSLIKRDFRGLLLGNVINFIDSKSKEYSRIVFGTDNINIYLDGNNLNIDFCNKSLENLSGGEQQRVDIIIQLAIRQMMCDYLNFSSNVLVLDEVLDYLDAKSAEATINLLIHVAQDIESTFFISHHSDELSIPYDETIVIEKDVNGVSKIDYGRI